MPDSLTKAPMTSCGEDKAGRDVNSLVLAVLH